MVENLTARADAETRRPAQLAAATSMDREGPSNASQTNATGMPDALKTGVEGLSGIAMDDVRVHYRSAKPAQLSAAAYTQGSDIYVGPGQEKHLPHEAWHVVQQKQGRVKATTQAKGMQINDSDALEREADVMGARALQTRGTRDRLVAASPADIVQRRIDLAKVNIIGEDHIEEEQVVMPEDQTRREVEKDMVHKYYNLPYLTEGEYVDDRGRLGDPPRQRTLTSFGLLSGAFDWLKLKHEQATYPLDAAAHERLASFIGHLDNETVELIANVERQRDQDRELWTGCYHFDKQQMAALLDLLGKGPEGLPASVIKASNAFDHGSPSREFMQEALAEIGERIEQIRLLLRTHSGSIALKNSMYPRSIRMFLVANAPPQQQPCVWKVGETHVQDILRSRQRNADRFPLQGATVTPKARFDYEVNRWRRLKREGIF